ncbi:MAG: NAD(P)-binding domain-containing protein, partial [Jatrophihabitantaceae bacterium]
TPRVCIVGAGRMGRALATRIGGDHQVVVTSRRPSRFTTVTGREVVVRADPAAVRGCAVVLLAVPAPGIVDAARWVAPHLAPDALVVNLATELPTPDLAVPGVRLVACKVIGQSGQIAQGSPAALIVDGADEAERKLLASVMCPVGAVIEASEDLVAGVNALVARRMITAQLELARELDAMGLPPAAREAAIGNLAVGVWGAVASGNTGPFLTKIVDEIAGCDADAVVR